MNMFVTGSAGFIGSHLVEALLEAGHDVKALVRYNSRGSIGHLTFVPEKLRSRLTVVSGDVRDSEFIERHIGSGDTVFHLAALIGIPYSYHAPRSYVQTNIEGTLSVLEACRKKGVRRLVVTSTSEVYGTAIYSPIDEIIRFKVNHRILPRRLAPTNLLNRTTDRSISPSSPFVRSTRMDRGNRHAPFFRRSSARSLVGKTPFAWAHSPPSVISRLSRTPWMDSFAPRKFPASKAKCFTSAKARPYRWENSRKPSLRCSARPRKFNATTCAFVRKKAKWGSFFARQKKPSKCSAGSLG